MAPVVVVVVVKLLWKRMTIVFKFVNDVPNYGDC